MGQFQGFSRTISQTFTAPVAKPKPSVHVMPERITPPKMTPSKLFQPVVRSFLGDDHVVNVAFAQARRGHAYKPGVLAKLRNRMASAVAHACAQPAYKLVHELGQHPFVGDAAFE